MRLIALCLAAVFAGQLPGDLGVEPVTAQSIAGPSTSPRDRLVRLTLEDGNSVKSAVWRAFGSGESDLEKTSPTSCVMVAQPGRYEVWAVWIDVAGELGDDVHALTIEGTPDPIPPGPDPDPEPTPPNPPTPPTPLSPLGVIARDAARLVAVEPVQRARDAQGLASLWHEAAAAVMSTASDAQRQEVLNAMAEEQRISLGTRYSAWQPALKTATLAMASTPIDLTIPNNLRDVLNQVADGWGAAAR